MVETNIMILHQTLLNNRIRLVKQFSILPGAYKIQMLNALDHLCEMNAHNFIIKPRASLIFIEEDEDVIENDMTLSTKQIDNNRNDNNTKLNVLEESTSSDDTKMEATDKSHSNETMETVLRTRTQELLATANEQQRFLADFLKAYLHSLLQYEQNRYKIENVSKPLPFHLVVNGLAGSGKSYVISIIEQMLTEYCISESAFRNRPRRRKGLLKMAHTGKAALNISGWTIHTALGMV